MRTKFFITLFVIAAFSISCSKNSDDSETKTETEVTNLSEDSPYYGWFKDKTEFSFSSVSITNTNSNGIVSEMKETSYYYVKDGKEAVRQITEFKIDGEANPSTEKIYITSESGNYVINPISKIYYKTDGDFNSTMFSKVWMWTRKRSDSYDALSTNSSATKANETLNSINVECYTISGTKFYFDVNKKLLKYIGSVSTTSTESTTEILFADYTEGNVPDFIDESIAKVSKDAYTISESQFGF
jgi:hypothetical protein